MAAGDDDDVAAAAQQLAAVGVVRCDEIEPLPEDAAAFWISSPASIVHLVSHPTVSERAGGKERNEVGALGHGGAAFG